MGDTFFDETSKKVSPIFCPSAIFCVSQPITGWKPVPQKVMGLKPVNRKPVLRYEHNQIFVFVNDFEAHIVAEKFERFHLFVADVEEFAE
jgi:hypothetical protein